MGVKLIAKKVERKVFCPDRTIFLDFAERVSIIFYMLTTTEIPAVPARKLDSLFNWTYQGLRHYGTLVPLDDFDKAEYSALPLKTGQMLVRYRTDVMVGTGAHLIIINPHKGLVYHLKDSDGDVPTFETRGLKGEFYFL